LGFGRLHNSASDRCYSKILASKDSARQFKVLAGDGIAVGFVDTNLGSCRCRQDLGQVVQIRKAMTFCLFSRKTGAPLCSFVLTRFELVRPLGDFWLVLLFQSVIVLAFVMAGIFVAAMLI
jgi:hypothetical protein